MYLLVHLSFNVDKARFEKKKTDSYKMYMYVETLLQRISFVEVFKESVYGLSILHFLTGQGDQS